MPVSNGRLDLNGKQIKRLDYLTFQTIIESLKFLTKLVFENYMHESGLKEGKPFLRKTLIFKAVSYVQELNLTLHYSLLCITQTTPSLIFKAMQKWQLQEHWLPSRTWTKIRIQLSFLSYLVRFLTWTGPHFN